MTGSALAKEMVDAAFLRRLARAISDQILGADSPLLAPVLAGEGLALMNDGNLGLASQGLERAVHLLAACAECKFQLAIAESNLGSLRLRRREYGQADKLLTDALAIMQEQSAPQAGADRAATMRLLAEVREKQKRHADAGALRTQAASILDR